MTRALAFYTVREAVRDVLPMLRTLSRVGVRSGFHASCLKAVRDRLHEFCNHFDPMISDCYFEDDYQAFADAWACCTAAYGSQWQDDAFFSYLRMAVNSLERIEATTGVA